MWKAAQYSGASGLGRPLCSTTGLSRLPSLAYSRPSALCNAGCRTFQTGTRRVLNASGGTSGGSGSSRSGRLVSDRIVIDEKSRVRMDLRREAMGSNGGSSSTGSGNNAVKAGGNKWAQSPEYATRTQPSPYDRAYEASQSKSYSRQNRPNSGNFNNQSSDPRQRQQGWGPRRSERYYDVQQARQNAPSSFATSSAFGFSAPTPKPAPEKRTTSVPSSFATSSTFGFSAPTRATNPSQPVKEATSSSARTVPAHLPSTKSTQVLDSFIAPTPATTSTAPQVKPVVSTPTPAAAPAQSVAASSITKTASNSLQQPDQTQVAQTFVKSTRSAKENARRQVEQRSKKRKQRQKPSKDVIIPDAISVSNLAGLLGARIGHFERTMKTLGMEVIRHDHILTSEEASLLALEYNVNPIVGSSDSLFDLSPQPEPEDPSIYPLRPPVVTIMGHVDHGKTTLLDSLRKTSVAAGEAGGITQHIGAFSVVLPSQQRITFLDTPGHAAFSAMRARGAHTTDIVVLVVAAEDGVMPQTAEAIKHAEEAGVPVIVAINKCDKYGAEPEKAKQALLKYGITVEDLGGETQCVEVSGLTGKNLDKLEEAILTLAEVLDLRAEVAMRGEGHIIESQIEKGRGNVATVLVKRGTLHVGDTIVAGGAWCKVKALVNDQGKNVKEAPPGTPVKVMGWKDLPKAGDEMLGAESEEQAKLVVSNRALKKERQEQLKTMVAINEKRRLVAEEEDEERTALREYKRKAWLFHQGVLDAHPEPPQAKKQLSVAAMAAKEEEENEVKNMKVVVKGDVSGTVEAVCDALAGLPANQVKLGVIQSGVGNISESDIQFASSCNAMILGFNVKMDKKLLQTARQMGVNVKSYNVIYKLLDDVKVEMASLLPKDIEIQVVGEATVAQVFAIKMKGGQTQNVAGCRVTNGGVSRKEDVRVVRNGEVIWDGRLSTLKRVKEDIQEAKKGTECGMEFVDFQDFKEGDVIQSVKKNEVLRKL